MGGEGGGRGNRAGGRTGGWNGFPLCSGLACWTGMRPSEMANASWEGKGSFSEADAAGIVRSMLRAVHHCHANGALYLDVKLENFLWAEAGGEGELKLADFGLAVLWDPTASAQQTALPFLVMLEVLRDTPLTPQQVSALEHSECACHRCVAEIEGLKLTIAVASNSAVQSPPPEHLPPPCSDAPTDAAWRHLPLHGPRALQGDALFHRA